MVENELIVRLVECAKPLNSVYDSNDPTQIVITGWADTTTVPKRGEICLEYYTNNDPSSENYGKICYRMKIGDGIHKYIESNPDDSLPYFPLSDDVINLIVSWVNTHLNVNEYAQANYNNSTNTLKIYSINEEYGKIGHLADSEDTPSLDIEVTFSAGTKINLASENNTLTITHEDTTRADTDNATDIAANTKVVTGVTTDATGHVTGITTYEFPEYTTIAPVQSVTGGNHITATTTNNAVTIDHDAVGTGFDVTPTSGTAPNWGGDVLTGVSIDSYGHVAGATKGALPSNPVSAASGTTNQIMVSDGDNTTSTSGKMITTTAPSSGSDDTTLPTSKAVNDSIDTKINTLDSSVSAGSNKVLTGVTEVDGKLTAKTDVDYTTIAPVQSVVGDNKWTSVSTSSNTATVSHIGPDTSSTSSATATQSTAPGFGGDVVTGVTIDSKGHVTGVTTGALPSNPVSSLEGTASDTASGITVQVDSTGGEVDNVDVTVALDTLKSALGLTGALIPKGTLGTGGTITTLPTASASNLGWAYKVITDGTYSGISAKVGDVIYCILNNDGTTYSWTLIPSGGESFTDTWRNIKVNGVEKLGTSISSGALDVVDGSHSSVSWNSTNKTLQIDVDEASTSQKGVVELTDSYTSTDDTKAATGKSIKAAIDKLDVATDKGAASISGTTLTIKAVQQEDGKIKDGGTTTINLESSYDASTNKIATQKTVTDAIEALDVAASETTSDITGTGLDVITEVSEVNGKIASKKKTLAEGNKIDISAASGSITIAHESITTTPTDNSVDPPDGLGDGERETYVITDVTTDGYGHITAYTKDKSTNLIAADIKAPVTKPDNSTWNFRETGGDITIGEDTARIPSLKGNTIVWNQLVNNGDFSDGTTGWIPRSEGQSTITATDGVATITFVPDSSNTMIINTTIANAVTNHKYLLKANIKGISGRTVMFGMSYNNDTPCGPKNAITFDTNDWVQVNIIDTLSQVTSNHYTVLFRSYDEENTFSINVKNVQLIDLTAMFGETIANSMTVEAFEKLFPAPYYSYNPGQLLNLTAEGIKTTGFNQWDEEWEEGNIDQYGNPKPSTTVIRSKNFIPVFPSAEYYFYKKNTPAINAIQEYDANKNYIRYQVYGDSSGEKNHTFTPTDKTRYIKFSVAVTAYQNDICINISSSRNGEYEPYKEYTLPLNLNEISVKSHNIWDEEWENGVYDSNGQKVADSSKIRSKNFIPISPNTAYYAKTAGKNMVIGFYDANKNYLGTGSDAYYKDTIVTTPANAYFATFWMFATYGATYNNNICINVSSSFNGQYEPHGVLTFNGLKSAGSISDEIVDGKKYVKRVVSYIITGNETKNYTNTYGGFFVILSSRFPWEKGTDPCDGIISRKYLVYTSSANPSTCPNGSVMFNTGYYSGDKIICIKDSSFTQDKTGAEALLTSMVGFEVNVALYTPIEYELVTPLPTSYPVYDKGTETQLPTGVDSEGKPASAPFVGTFEYMSNFKDGVLDLMGRFSEFTPTTKIIPDSNSTLPTSQAVIDYMRAGGNGVKPVYESGDEVTPTTDAHAGLKTEVGNNSYKYYKIPFSAVTNDPSEGTSQVQIILNGNFS